MIRIEFHSYLDVVLVNSTFSGPLIPNYCLNLLLTSKSHLRLMSRVHLTSPTISSIYAATVWSSHVNTNFCASKAGQSITQLLLQFDHLKSSKKSSNIFKATFSL
jgi:hypothetical protein